MSLNSMLWDIYEKHHGGDMWDDFDRDYDDDDYDPTIQCRNCNWHCTGGVCPRCHFPLLIPPNNKLPTIDDVVWYRTKYGNTQAALSGWFNAGLVTWSELSVTIRQYGTRWVFGFAWKGVFKKVCSCESLYIKDHFDNIIATMQKQIEDAIFGA